MLYKEKLAHCLKTEQNAINKMYLNELLINWKKVEAAIEEAKEFPVSAMISAISAYTKNLTVAKFKYNPTKKCGFAEDHDIFQGYYLYDIVEKILDVAGIKEGKQGIVIKNKAFNTGFRLERNSYKKIVEKPKLEQFTSSKYLNVGLEFDFNYKLTGKKHYTKTMFYVPLIVFYIDKYYTERSFEEITQLKKDIKAINPRALLICLTESVERRLLSSYAEIAKHMYVLRANYKDDEYNDMQPQVGLSLYNKLHSFVRKDFLSFDKVISFGNIDLVQKTKPVETQEEQ